MIKLINQLLGSDKIISKGKKVRLVADESIILNRTNLIIIFEILCKMVNIETEVMYVDKISNYYMNTKSVKNKKIEIKYLILLLSRAKILLYYGNP